MPQNYVVAHDWWAAQVISLYGKIFFNDNVDLLYRIHSENEVGLPGTLARVKRSLSLSPHIQSRQALEILRHEANVDDSNTIEVEDMRIYWERIYSGNGVSRLRIALTGVKARKSYLEDLWRRLIMLIKTQ